ncbi:MAG TPA: hypothetical protein VIQ04_01115, partial [Nitrososphaeraceae archaeon]
MDEIPTAEQIMKNKWSKYLDNHIDISSTEGQSLIQEIIKNCMIEFAKLHVQAQSEAMLNNSLKMSSTRDS